MADQYPQLSKNHIDFIQEQPVFFVASASGCEVNLSPKGLDSLRVLSGNELLFLDFPGSGNRTARDIREGGKVTLMFNSFSGAPLVLRTFCQGELIEKEDQRFDGFLSAFEGVPPEKTRRIILLKVQVVETSCGFGVPIMRFEQERTQLPDWLDRKLRKNNLQTYIDDHDQPIDLSL